MIDDPLVPSCGVFADTDKTVCWRVWAPEAKRVDLILDPGSSSTRLEMIAEARGHFAVVATGIEPGQRYAYSLDGGDPLPDPLSRWQPNGIDQPSAVFFPDRMEWGDEGGWTGISEQNGLVFYELHVGTFTQEGTFDSIVPRLQSLRDLGITAIELMPVSQFPGIRGWGYDGVHPFAPQHNYGGPDGLRRLVEAIHRAGMAAFLDVVYNHFGPEGNHFNAFGSYFNERYRTDWGSAVNFDGNASDPVRRMVLDNVRMWIRDYRFDGLRLDAADQIFDRGNFPILSEVAELAHREAGRIGRRAFVFAETDLNNARRFLLDPQRGGYGLDGQWNDDFHHALHVALTGDDSGYFRDFSPGPQALAKVFSDVFVNDGIYSPFRDRRHGGPASEFDGGRFVAFTQNHDQVANGNLGRRHAKLLPPSSSRLAAGLLLLAPRLPLIFQGEEYGETRDFPYFCDIADPDLREAIRKGRAEEFAYFDHQEPMADPLDASTRDAAVLSWDWSDPVRSGLRLLYADLLRLRRELPGLRKLDHARSRVLESGKVLEIIRGDGPDAIRIYFNLSTAPVALQVERPLLRSEVSRYGAPEILDDIDLDRLEPHEFVVFGSPE